MDNKFKDIFSDDKKLQEAMQNNLPEPSPRQLIETIAQLMGTNKEWFKNPLMRLIVCGVSLRLYDHAMKKVEEGNNKPFDLGTTAFMMLVHDMLLMTKEYASDEELERYHGSSETEEDFGEED